MSLPSSYPFLSLFILSITNYTLLETIFGYYLSKGREFFFHPVCVYVYRNIIKVIISKYFLSQF